MRGSPASPDGLGGQIGELIILEICGQAIFLLVHHRKTSGSPLNNPSRNKETSP
jgi:hypothetical protein